MSEILLCNKCNKFPANINILEIEKTICKLCELETQIFFKNMKIVNIIHLKIIKK